MQEISQKSMKISKTTWSLLSYSKPSGVVRYQWSKQFVRSGEFKWEYRNRPLERTALHEVVAAHKRDIVRELLRHSESAKYIELPDINGRTALHEAASRGNQGIMRDLLGNRANVDPRDRQYLYHYMWWCMKTLLKRRT
ncbi:hypothetical protein K469DRAFT_19528 [Zopfia rhizophila CBS 207.26]|uniref:Uncharacterized protein n=1 Tax=Zopfia rhizophila CBS 207.26 TaxID=1314779 RepID=A0A6A6F0C8_9PEZI|nr:hypothetical protein K469DRAFT_19528 [Zopfia rhizophila CBS 207.26]